MQASTLDCHLSEENAGIPFWRTTFCEDEFRFFDNHFFQCMNQLGELWVVHTLGSSPFQKIRELQGMYQSPNRWISLIVEQSGDGFQSYVNNLPVASLTRFQSRSSDRFRGQTTLADELLDQRKMSLERLSEIGGRGGARSACCQHDLFVPRNQLQWKNAADCRLGIAPEFGIDSAQPLFIEKDTRSIGPLSQLVGLGGISMPNVDRGMAIFGMLFPFLAPQLCKVLVAQRYNTSATADSASMAIPLFFVGQYDDGERHKFQALRKRKKRHSR
jgi:hypothetical protein